jgi:cytochrome c biogenesis protein CcmG/thiol:disulfide interchange protein DsbE
MTTSQAPAPAPARRPILPAILIAAAVLAVLALMAYGLSIQGRTTIGGVPVRNSFGEVSVTPKAAQPFALGLLAPTPGAFTLADQQGKVVLVDFWASWCQPCRDEAPALQRVYQNYHTRGVAFIGIDVFDQNDDALAYIRQFGLTYPTATDPGGEVAIEYGLAGVPEKFLIDKQGRLVRRFVGPMTEDTLRGLLDEQLAAQG